MMMCIYSCMEAPLDKVSEEPGASVLSPTPARTARETTKHLDTDTDR